MNAEEYKETLCSQIEGTAQWRLRKSEQYPDDLRNRTSADSLAKLAQRMLRLSPKNRYLERVCRLENTAAEMREEEPEEDRIFEFMEILSHTLSRYGFDAPEDGNPQWFLRDLINSYQRHIEEHEEVIKTLEAERIAALPILFVEGATDATILEAAWRALFPSQDLAVNILASNGTKEMQSLAASGRALREVLPSKAILVLADNDHSGRRLVNDGHLHKGGVWRHLTNGIHWCLLSPTHEFATTMERLQIPKDCWPCTIEMCFSAEVRRRAEKERAYAFSGEMMQDLYLLPEIAKRIGRATRRRRKSDDSYFYVMSPSPAKKRAFAGWVAGKGALAAGDFAAFEPLFAGLQQILSQAKR